MASLEEATAYVNEMAQEQNQDAEIRSRLQGITGTSYPNLDKQQALDESGQHYLNDYHILATMPDNRLKDCILRYRNLAKLAEQELLARKDGLRGQQPLCNSSTELGFNLYISGIGSYDNLRSNSFRAKRMDKRKSAQVSQVAKGIKLLSKSRVNLDYVIRSLLNNVTSSNNS